MGCQNIWQLQSEEIGFFKLYENNVGKFKVCMTESNKLMLCNVRSNGTNMKYYNIIQTHFYEAQNCQK